ncbi:MAG: transposase [Burkholderiales bacterium]|nr:transposase [Burkholderiales bacterium]
MFFEELTDDEWARLAPLAADEPMHPHRRGRPRAEPRVVANAVLWILTTGERWSKLPARYPSGPTCRRRFDDWLADGTLSEIIKVLSEFGRTFAYVPQPETAPQSPAPKAAPVPAPESPRLRGVFWTNPESWQSTNGEFDDRETNEHGTAINACSNTVRGEAPVASSRRAPTPGAQLRASDDRSHDTQLVDSMIVTKRSEGYRHFIIHASAQPVAKQFQLSYRASTEIVKDGRRVERSGLIGPRFTDRDSAERYALDWARDWIDRHVAAAQPRLEVVADAGATPQPDAKPTVEAEAGAPVAAASSQSAPPTIEPSLIRSNRTPEWLLHTHADGRGDAKPPEVLYHA